MSASPLRLESFARMIAPTQRLSEADLLQAWQAGCDQGRSEAIAASLGQLSEDIRALQAQLALHDTERDRLRGETLAAVGSVLHAIVDLLGPTLLCDRLIEEITHEISRLNQPDAPISITLRCPPGLGGFLRAGLEQAGSTGTVTEDDALPAATVELIREGGHTRFEPEQMLTRCKAILHEFLNRE